MGDDVASVIGDKRGWIKVDESGMTAMRGVSAASPVLARTARLTRAIPLN